MEVSFFAEDPSVSAINKDNTTESLKDATVKTDISVKVDFNAPILETDVNATMFKIVKMSDSSIVPLKLTQSDDKAAVVLSPTTALAANTEYKVTVAKDIQSKDLQHKLAEAYEVSFKTGDYVAVSKLTVGGMQYDTATVKGIFRKNVEVGDQLILGFPTNLKAATVDGQNVKVVDEEGKQVPAVVSYEDTNKTVILSLGQALNVNKKYALTANELKTADGKQVLDYKYEFVVSQDYAPQVQLANGDFLNANTDVYGRLVTENYAGIRKVEFKLNVAFRAVSVGPGLGPIQAMDEKTLNEDNVWVEDTATETKVQSTLTYDAGSQVLSVVPKAELKENTEYRLVILPNVRNSAGLKAEATNIAKVQGGSGLDFGEKVGSKRYEQTFTTGYYVRPLVKDSSIKQGATDVEADTKVFTVRFDKKLHATEPAISTLVANKAVKLIDNSLNDEELHLGTGAGDGQNTVTIAKNNEVLSISFGGGKSLENALDKNGQIDGKAYNPVTNNRKGHTFTLFIAGESLGANALKDEYGNPLAEDYKLTFSVPAADTTAPKVVNVLAMAQEDGVGSNEHKVELSKTEVVTNVQGDGSLAANEGFKVVFSEKMNATGGANSANTAANYVLEMDANNDGVITAAEGGLSIASATNPSGDGKTFVLVPTNTNLAADKKAQLIIKNIIVDLEGNAIGTDQKYVFVTGAGPKLATGVGATDPAPFATAWAQAGKRKELKIEFNSTNPPLTDINPLTLTNEYIVVKEKASNDIVTGKFYKDAPLTEPVVAATDTVYFQPDNAWESGKSYTVTLKKGIKNVLGNVSKEDYTYEFSLNNDSVPAIVSTSIRDGEAGVAVDAEIKVVFSEDVKADGGAAAVDHANNFKVEVWDTLANNWVALNGKISYDSASKTATFVPSNYFAVGLRHKVTIAAAIEAVASGQPLTGKTEFEFATSSTERLPILVSAVYKGSSAANAGRLVLTFDKPAVNGTGNITGFTLNNGAVVGGTFTVSSDKKTLVITGITDAGTTIIPGVTTIAPAAALKAEDNNGTVAGGNEFDVTHDVTITE